MVGRLIRRSYHLNPGSVQTNLLKSALPNSADEAQMQFANAVRTRDLFLMHLLWFCTLFVPHLLHY